MIGTTAGSYRITDVLSVGGMGTVYRAEHTLIGRLAAVKVLLPEMSSNEEIVHRFFNEAKATTSIKHPGIVEIYDYGNLPSGHAYIVMEFLEGRTLSQRNKQRSPLHEAEAAALLRGVCGALAAAHAKHIVHRDLKPDNIFLVPDADSALGERAKILDFGIAKLTDIGLAGTATKTGAVMGTPTYMSPEQCKGTGDVDHRADLYSIGCIFYEMVAGRPPFTNKGAGELIGAHLFMQPEPPSKHGAQISPEAEALIMALLAKNPADRPQTAAELAQLLTNIAARGGYGSAVNWERPSMPAMAAPNAPTHYTPSHTSGAPVHFTPGHTPYPGVPTVPAGHGGSSPHLAQRASSQHGSSPHLASQPSISIEYGTNPSNAEKPTTLSGAASQASPSTGSGSRKWIAAVGGLVVAGGVIAAVLVLGGGGSSSTSAASSSSSSTPPSSASGEPATASTAPASGTATAPASATGTAPAPATGTATAPASASATGTATAPATGTATASGTAADTTTKPAADTTTKTATDTSTKTATDTTTKTATDTSTKTATDTSTSTKTKTSTSTNTTKTTNTKTNTKTKTKTKTSDPLLETDL